MISSSSVKLAAASEVECVVLNALAKECGFAA
jgi:hypothetical protein